MQLFSKFTSLKDVHPTDGQIKIYPTVLRLLLTLLILLFGFPFTTDAQPDTVRIESLYKKVLEVGGRNGYEESEKLIREAIELSIKLGDSSLIARGYAELAETYFFKKELDGAEEYARKALNYCNGKCKPSTRIKIASALGGIHSFKGRYAASLEYYNEGLRLSKEWGREDYYTDLLFNKSTVLGDMGRYEEMLSSLLKCKEYYEEKNILDKLATIHNNIGLAYNDRFDDPKMAMDHYREAIRLNTQVENRWNLSRNYHNLALVFLKTEEYDSAQYYLSQAIDLKKEVGDEGGLSMLYHAMGKLNLQRGDFGASENYYTLSRRIVEKYGITEGLYYTSVGLGLVSDSTGKPSQALRRYEEALKFAVASDNLKFLRNSWEHIYRHHKTWGNHEQALAALERTQTFADSLAANKSDEKLLELKAKYEVELRDKENAVLRAEQERQEALLSRERILKWIFIGAVIVSLLMIFALVVAYRSRNKAYRMASQGNRELERMNNSLQSKTDELNDINLSKDRLFSVISHDLRSPLASVEGCLALLADDMLTDEERRELMQNLRSETHNTLKTLDDLLEWSKVQISGTVINKTDFNINNLVGEVRDLYAPLAAAKNVNLAFIAEKENYVHADSNQIQTVVRNLVSNAIKFTPENGTVSIRTERKDGVIKICVMDEGQGISDDVKERIFNPKEYYTSQGTKGETGTGVGLMLSLEYLQRNNSKLYFEKIEPTGTNACFSLKAADDKASTSYEAEAKSA